MIYIKGLMTQLAIIVGIIVMPLLVANKIVYNGWFSFPWSEENCSLQERRLKSLERENDELRARIAQCERDLSKTSAYR